VRTPARFLPSISLALALAAPASASLAQGAQSREKKPRAPTVALVVWGGGARAEDADAAEAAIGASGLSTSEPVTNLLSSGVTGLKPGLHLAVLGACPPAEAAAVLRQLLLSTSAVAAERPSFPLHGCPGSTRLAFGTLWVPPDGRIPSGRPTLDGRPGRPRKGPMSDPHDDWNEVVRRLTPGEAPSAELLATAGRQGTALSTGGVAVLLAGEVGRYLATREQRLRLKVELEARRAALQTRLRELELVRAANRTFLEAQCKDRADARAALVTVARDLIGVAEAVIRAAGPDGGADTAELVTLARESLAAAVEVIREKFPSGALATVAPTG